MVSFNPRKFSDPDRLRAIAPERLRAFLAPWHGYLGQRGFEFPAQAEDEIDYDALAAATQSYTVVSKAFEEAGIARKRVG